MVKEKELPRIKDFGHESLGEGGGEEGGEIIGGMRRVRRSGDHVVGIRGEPM